MILDTQEWGVLVSIILVGMILLQLASWYDKDWGDPT